MKANASATPNWQGIHHLAMITPDMDETVRFYCGVLGMPLVATVCAGPMRHYFFELGTGNTIAFFEDPRAETFEKPAGLMSRTDLQFDHLSFALATEKDLTSLIQRLEDAQCDITRIVDHQIIRSVYFHDNNGIALEASYWTVPIENLGFKPDDEVLFADPNPVPSVKEMANGQLLNIPKTTFPSIN
ncbi:MAG: VOC family protein [Actinomycetota bacterium]